MANPTLYDNFTRVKNWAVEKFADKETLANTLSDVAFSGNYNDLSNTPDLSSYASKSDLNSYVSKSELSAYVTKEMLSAQSYVTTTALESMAYATESYVMGKVNALIDGAPAALDTLNELAAAINDDANYAATVTTALGTKANAADVYSKTEIQGMAYITMADVSAQGYITSIPAEYITETELSGCGYVTALTQAQMDTLFPLSNS